MAPLQTLTLNELKQHSTADDCWLLVNGNVWDFTDFVPNHPGGSDIICKYAGRDASTTYNAIHAPSIILDNFGPQKLMGNLDAGEAASDPTVSDPAPSSTAVEETDAKPPLSTLISSYDFEEVASRTLTPKCWAFYSSAATDLLTRDANKSMFDRIWWRPRVMRDVRDVSTQTSILGCNVSLPLFVSPAAMARLVHPDGEIAIAAGCANQGVAMCISTNASFPVGEITATAPGHPFFFQLYVNKDRSASEKLLARAKDCGIKGIFVTVDVPVAGKREADERVKNNSSVITAPMSGAAAKNDVKGGGLGRTMGGYIDATLNWNDLKWLRSVTDLPIVLKGIQCADDARLAMQYGVDGIVVSNHGGRSLDTSPPSILVLLELRKLCPEIFSHLEVYVDSGIRRGTDILKCICLGAKAVGMGRNFLYALNYGQEGIEHFIEIMKDELETSMRLLGITSLDQAHPGLLNSLDLDRLVPSTMDFQQPIIKKRQAKL